MNKPFSFLLLLVCFSSLAISQQAWKNKYDSLSLIVSEGTYIIYKNGKAGYAEEKTGKEIVSPQYDKARMFRNGFAIVSKRAGYDKLSSGVINKSGKEIVPPIYDYISDINDGIAIIALNEKFGIMDKTGKKLVPPKYSNLWEFSGGMAAVSIYDKNKGKDKWGFIDKKGKEIIPLKYERVCSYKDGIAVVDKGEKKYFIVNKNGKETALNYERIGFKGYGLLLVELNKKFGFINSKGEVAIPLIYDNAHDFYSWQRNGYLTNVRLGNKEGVIDTSGKEIILIKYDLVGLFREGLAAVTMDFIPAVDSKNGYVDSVGNLVIPMIYNSAGNFSEGIAAVSKNWGKKF